MHQVWALSTLFQFEQISHSPHTLNNIITLTLILVKIISFSVENTWDEFIVYGVMNF